MKKWLFACVLLLFLLIYFRSNGQPADNTSHLKLGAIDRQYILHVPESFGKTSNRSLVIAFHGGYGQARGMDRLTGFNSLSEREGFLLAYPDGMDRHWNDGRETIRHGPDDVAFISALIDRLVLQFSIDPRRVYATGISNGGFFSLRLACDLSEKIAAVASVAASMPEVRTAACMPTKPVSVLFISGVADPIVPYYGGEVKHRGSFGYVGKILSATRAAAWWAEKNRCSKTAARDPLPDIDREDRTRVLRIHYAGGLKGTEVTLLAIEGGGHTWPGGWQYLPAILVGRTSRDIDASKEIWNFFQQHSR